ncbi:MAG: YqeG family HAD IIIA-type phosphatase [Oscillospiraceae bacterium]|jgi:HAD superfamily phosphatase (TIGR01668 family)|nr:YqeG family HAD IIIA-type phosphatase [Oscillospiraceae bacterium]
MRFSPVPRYAFPRLTDVTADFLRGIGVTLLLLDLDNTVAPYGAKLPSEAVLQWLSELKNSGVRLFFISNNRQRGRVERFAEAMEIGYVKAAGKPSPRAVLETVRRMGVTPSQTALAGDQVYTDVLAANRAGVVSIAVRPLRLKNPILAIRYALEAPFRMMRRGGDDN